MNLLEKIGDYIYGTDYKDYAPHPRILTANERNFYSAMKDYFKGFYVLPKICLRSIFRAKERLIFSNYNEKAAIRHKHIDFSVVDNNFNLLYCFELDDSSHNMPDRIARDLLVNGIFEDAGIPLIRVPASKSYNEDIIKMSLMESMTAHATNNTYKPAVLFSKREKRLFEDLHSRLSGEDLLCYKVTLKEFFQSKDNVKFYKISSRLVTFAIFDTSSNCLRQIIMQPKDDDEIICDRFIKKLCRSNGIDYIQGIRL